MLSPSSWHVLSPSIQVCDQECVLSVLSGGGGAVPESMPVPGMWPVGTGRGGLGDSPPRVLCGAGQWCVCPGLHPAVPLSVAPSEVHSPCTVTEAQEAVGSTRQRFAGLAAD